MTYPRPVSYQAWRQSGRFVPVSGRSIFVRSVGAGPPLLFLHGFPTSSYDWATVVGGLAGRFRCITFDFLGFGASDKPAEHRYQYDEQTGIAEAVAASEGVERALVVAHDYGVTVGQELLARQRDGMARLTLDGIVFLNGGLLPAQHRPLLIQRVLGHPRLGPLLSPILVNRTTFARSLRRTLGRPGALSEAEADEHWAAIQQQDGAARTSQLLQYMAERRARAPRWFEALTRAPVPIRFVWGLVDPVSGGHVMEAVRRHIAGADIVALDGVGHYPQLEAPDAVRAAIEAFADRLAGASQARRPEAG